MIRKNQRAQVWKHFVTPPIPPNPRTTSRTKSIQIKLQALLAVLFRFCFYSYIIFGRCVVFLYVRVFVRARVVVYNIISVCLCVYTLNVVLCTRCLQVLRIFWKCGGLGKWAKRWDGEFCILWLSGKFQWNKAYRLMINFRCVPFYPCLSTSTPTLYTIWEGGWCLIR